MALPANVSRESEVEAEKRGRREAAAGLSSTGDDKEAHEKSRLEEWQRGAESRGKSGKGAKRSSC